MTYLLVFLGGGLGAALRHGVNIGTARWLGTHFPYGTLTVNVTGSLVMGLLVAYLAFNGGVSQHWRLFRRRAHLLCDDPGLHAGHRDALTFA